MKTRYRLIHRVIPHEHEDLVGFLMRVASRNYLSGPSEILRRVFGSHRHPVHLRDTIKIADYTRNTINEIAQLSGIECRRSGEDRAWQVSGEWVTKAVFVSQRSARVCPICLQEDAHIRGLWSLRLYAVCAVHGARLVDQCPACKRMIKWDRVSPRHCGCGFDLAGAPLSKSRGADFALAKLLGHRTLPGVDLHIDIGLSINEIERLANLSLDGLCKTVWFLGHCLGELGGYSVGHGRRKPHSFMIENLAMRTFNLMQAWPSSLGAHLHSLFGANLNGNSSLEIDHLFSPVRHYLREDLAGEELSFLVAAYEQHVRMLWRQVGRQRYLAINDRQLQLKLD